MLGNQSPVPARPVNLRVSPGQNSATLQWDYVAAGYAGPVSFVLTVEDDQSTRAFPTTKTALTIPYQTTGSHTARVIAEAGGTQVRGLPSPPVSWVV